MVTHTDFSFCPTTDLGFIGRFARVHMEFGRTTRERSDWQSPADWSSSDQTRERTDWQSADWDSSDEARKATAWQSPFSWQ